MVLQLVQALGQERLMFEAADPHAFAWCGAGWLIAGERWG